MWEVITRHVCAIDVVCLCVLAALLRVAAGHFADALIARKWTVLSVRRLMTCVGLIGPGIFLLFFSAVNQLALAVL